MRGLVLFIVITLISIQGYGQRYMLPDTMHVFGDRVHELLLNIPTGEADSIGREFKSRWGGYTEFQKRHIMDLSITMLKKNTRLYPNIKNFFGMLIESKGAYLTSAQTDSLLVMLDKSYEYYDSRTYERIVINLKEWFTHAALHKTRNNSLYTVNLKFDFTFKTPEDAPVSYADQLLRDEPAEAPEVEQSITEWGEEDYGWGDDDDGWGDESDSWDASGEEDTWGDSGWEEETTEAREEPQESIESFLAQTVAAEPMPEPEGAIINFHQVDFIFVTRYDSVKLSGTKGDYELAGHYFVGDGGTFTWGNTQLKTSGVYAKLKKFNFDVWNPEVTAENATLHFDEMLEKPVEGYFEFRSVKYDTITEVAYPRFMSYANDLTITNLGDEFLTYKGGFGLIGAQKIGASWLKGKGVLKANSEDGRKYRSESKRFVFGDSLITAKNAYLTVYHGRDSIFHPSVRFNYYTNNHQLFAYKEEGGYNLTPFNSSYFKLSIDTDMIKWDITADSVDIGTMNARSMVPSLFESYEYYHFDKINELASVYNFNPLLSAYFYANKKKSREFFVHDMARDMKLNENALMSSMELLHYRDFVEFNQASGRVYLKDKALHYMRSKSGKKDYDDLLIPSLPEVGVPNATLHLDKNEMTVRGIEKFYISETLDVYIFPRDSSIRLKENRDFEFEGQMFAGNFEFVGRNFTFRYNDFLVDMPNIDSVRFYVDDEYEKQQVDNKMVSLEMFEDAVEEVSSQSTSGTLYINKPNNKSGQKIFPDYPKFDASRGAIVYFDREDILDSAYNKSVYFVVPPFAIDSLSAEDPAAIGFEGTFVSGGIFPDIKEKLRIMPDNSLGFEHNTSSNGYNVYGGGGKFYNTIRLDKNGLTGRGKIEYLTTSMESENYTFYQDSVLGDAYNFEIKSGSVAVASFPDIKSDSVQLKWEPYKDKMAVSNVGTPFDLYNQTASLDGTAFVSAQGANGSGTFFARGFEAESEDFNFEDANMTARHSDFVVNSDNPEKPLMEGDDIRLDFDLINNVGELSPEVEGVAALEFPYAQVKTSISQATWDLEAGKVRMVKPADVDIKYSYFYSTREELDSLAFNATAAEYDLSTSELLVQGIPYIKVADARITPENNEVLVLENSSIGTLFNTKIVIDTLHGYHQLYDGTINIINRNKFLGSATYQFVNAAKDTFAIEFDEFELKEDFEGELRKMDLQTVSGGEIVEEDNLIISPGMQYKGKVTMYAQQKALELDGYVRLPIANRPDNDTWIKYESFDEETQEVIFDFNNSVTENGEKLSAGIHYYTNDHSLYATIVEDRKLISDEDFFVPNGYLRYDLQRGVYAIEDTSKAFGSALQGKLFTFNDNTGDITWEGLVNFIEPNENLIIEASAIGQGNTTKSEYAVNTFMKFDFEIPDLALTTMSQDMRFFIETLGAPEAESDLDLLLYKMAAFTGDRAAMEFDQQSISEYVPLASVSSKLISDIVFSKLDMKWSETHKAWYSDGQVGLSHIKREDLNALLDGFVEIKKTDEGDVVKMFIQVSPESWYFLGYEENRLILFSSNPEFNDIIASKTKVDKTGFGEFVFVLGDQPDVLNFINMFRLDYLGIEEPYEMSMPRVEEPNAIDELLDVIPDTEVTEEEDEDEGF
jgi:hypothetical protein